MLGLEPDSYLGAAASEMIFDEDRSAVMLQFDRVMRGELKDLRIECRLQHRDGNPVWALLAASLLRSDVTGRPLYAIVQIINIDRQKRAEAALAESESRWNYALESAGQGVWDHDVRRDDMFYSRMWRRMRGIPDDEYVDPSQEKWLERVHPGDVQRILETVKKQDHGVDGYDTLEYRERHRNGGWIWILSRGKPVEWDAEGNAIRTVGTDTDITRLKLAEGQLAQEKERLRVTLHSIGEGVISADDDGRVIFMNPVAEIMTGRPNPRRWVVGCRMFSLPSVRRRVSLLSIMWHSAWLPGSRARSSTTSFLPLATEPGEASAGRRLRCGPRMADWSVRCSCSRT
jgi:PAS domain S-box-containing protein